MQRLDFLRAWYIDDVRRVVHTLKIKAIEYQTVLEDITNKSTSLLEYNPVHKRIPVLVHNEKPICESLVIIEYIDDTWKQRPLIPRDPWNRAMARFWANFGDEKVSRQPFTFLYIYDLIYLTFSKFQFRSASRNF